MKNKNLLKAADTSFKDLFFSVHFLYTLTHFGFKTCHFWICRIQAFIISSKVVSG